MKHIKNILLFLASPFIALAYLFALPLLGLLMLGRTLIEALSEVKYISNQDMLNASNSQKR